MKLHQTVGQGQNLITAYDADQIQINQNAFTGNLIITPSSVSEWQVANFEALKPEHFSALLALNPEVVLLGTGGSLRFPHPRLTAELINAHIGVEVMDTPAACRCYNILMAEDRRVVAVVLNS